LIRAFEAFDATGVPGIPYISAWQHQDNDIWYEFAGRQCLDLLGCTIDRLGPCFREAVVDHRLFHRTEVEAGVRESALSQNELSKMRDGMRAEVTQRGNLEADYKIALAGEANLWLKDQARVETFADDQVTISIGFLTDVTNEMVHKDLLEQIGYFDPLTNLPNRLVMHRSLELKIAQHRRKQIGDFVFLMMDIDHFKRVNDSLGHQAGDYVLTTLGQVLNDVKRRSDEIGRYGGEEFFGIVLGSILEGRDFAERIRRRVQATPFVFKTQRIPITVSIGMAAAGEDHEPSEGRLIERADRRLYEAKQLGRNRIVSETVSF
jgi:diguanylate cyclase (GGDEF)-like protein